MAGGAPGFQLRHSRSGCFGYCVGVVRSAAAAAGTARTPAAASAGAVAIFARNEDLACGWSKWRARDATRTRHAASSAAVRDAGMCSPRKRRRATQGLTQGDWVTQAASWHRCPKSRVNAVHRHVGRLISFFGGRKFSNFLASRSK